MLPKCWFLSINKNRVRGSEHHPPLCWYRPKAINTRLNCPLPGALCAASVAKEPQNAGNASGQL